MREGGERGKQKIRLDKVLRQIYQGQHIRDGEGRGKEGGSKEREEEGCRKREREKIERT